MAATLHPYLLEWANLLLRWLHVITAIAWIGTSFHFVLTDDRLYKPTDPDLLDKGVDGESWAVHGGGFYHFNKYRVAPRQLPEHLHWSFWEAYSTWLSGFALLTVLYFFNASTFLVDPRVFDWSPITAIVGAIAYLIVGWVVYDGICRLVGRDRDGNVGGDLKVGVLVFVYVCVAAWVACHLFAGRAAFLLTGAMLATMMSANVAMVIIPGQRKVVAALRAGQTPDANFGKRGKQRSVHNTYVTLPVIVAMISNHYGMLTQGRWNWLALILLMAGGAVVRLFFVLRHKGPSRWELVPAALLLIGAAAWVGAPDRPVDPESTAVPTPEAASPAATATTTTATATTSAAVATVATAATPSTALEPVSFARVQGIVETRCAMCHNGQIANKGVRLDSADAIVRHARDIEQQAVVLRAMPFNNATSITDAERAALGRWVEAGASTR